MKIRLTKSFLYSLFLHGTIVLLVLALLLSSRQGEKAAVEKRCKVMLSQVCECPPEKSEQEPAVVERHKKMQPKKKMVKKERVEKLPSPVVKEEVVEDPVEEVEEELVEIVDEKTPVDAVDDEEAKEVVVMPEMPAVLSPAGQQAIDAPPAEVMSPEDAYVKAHIAEIMALLRKNLYYPRMARKRGIEGTVIVRFELLASGKVKNIIIVEASRKILGQAAVTTIKRLNGKFPLPSERLFLNVPIMYRLR